ncbi:MAG: hypothetical protein KGP28_05680 [Bdellovibrionales bacterium]|nr:hypothetical protein [Bdellovibrionales bacterium]
MIKALIVGFVFLGSLTAHAQMPVLKKVVEAVASEGKVSGSQVATGLMNQVKSSSSPLARVVQEDPLYKFTNGNLDEEGLRYLGNDAQMALIQLGKTTTFKSVSNLADFEIALKSVSSLENAVKNVPMSKNGYIKSAVSVEDAIENEVRTLGLSESVAADLSKEMKGLYSDFGLRYSNRGMCKGLDDEAATNFAAVLRDTRENLKRTKMNCPSQLYGAIAEVWIQFQKRMGREGDSLWRAVEKNQTCYVAQGLRPHVLNAVNLISTKHGGQVPAENQATGCPL